MNEFFTLILSRLWSLTNAFVRQMKHAKILRPISMGCRVVSVGNIQVGGAGKTPLVAQIAREAIERGMKVCILSRGYKGVAEKAGALIFPGDAMSARYHGDEPTLLHELVPQAYLAIGRNRVKQFFSLRSQTSPFDLVILDDGFQHWKIRKDVEIVAVTSALPGEILYREFSSALDHADLVVWTQGARLPEGPTPHIRVKYHLSGTETEAPLWLLTAVANGRRVRDLANQAGYNVAYHFECPDHQSFDFEFVERVKKHLKKDPGCRLAMTGKDWVKWRDLDSDKPHPVILEPRMEFVEGRQQWEKVLWGVLSS